MIYSLTTKVETPSDAPLLEQLTESGEFGAMTCLTQNIGSGFSARKLFPVPTCVNEFWDLETTGRQQSARSILSRLLQTAITALFHPTTDRPR